MIEAQDESKRYTYREVEALLHLHLSYRVSYDVTPQGDYRLRHRIEKMSRKDFRSRRIDPRLLERADLFAALKRLSVADRGILYLWYGTPWAVEMILEWYQVETGLNVSRRTLFRRRREAVTKLVMEMNGGNP